MLELAALDPRLAAIEAAAGPLPWRVRQPGFPGLLRAICGQQISNQAAAAIWRRLSALPGALKPEGLLALDDAALCGTAGLSRPKAAHARSLARACLDGRLDFAALRGMADAEALARIAAVPGLGPWTAAIHLLFAEQRPDVFPAGDLALAASAAHLFGSPARPRRANWRRWRWAGRPGGRSRRGCSGTIGASPQAVPRSRTAERAATVPAIRAGAAAAARRRRSRWAARRAA